MQDGAAFEDDNKVAETVDADEESSENLNESDILTKESPEFSKEKESSTEVLKNNLPSSPRKKNRLLRY